MAFLPDCGWWYYPGVLVVVTIKFPKAMDESHLPSKTLFVVKIDGNVKQIDNLQWDANHNLSIITVYGTSEPSVSCTVDYDGSDTDFKSAEGDVVSAFTDMNCFYTKEGGDTGFPGEPVEQTENLSRRYNLTDAVRLVRHNKWEARKVRFVKRRMAQQERMS